MPTTRHNTRSQANQVASSSAVRLEDVPLFRSASESGLSVLDETAVQTNNVHEADDLDVYVARLGSGVRQMREELNRLRAENAHLRQQLDSTEESPDVSMQPRRGRRGGPTVTSLQSELKKAKKELAKSQAGEARHKKRVNDLIIKEAKREARELAAANDGDTLDSDVRMRKLLNQFSDLMLSALMPGEGHQDCAICFDQLTLDECLSLPCEHVFCRDCIQRSMRVANDTNKPIQCPQCRKPFTEDDTEIVTMTADTQWDELLRVALDWQKISQRHEVETSEEEKSEGFLDDGSVNGSSKADETQDSDTTAPEHKDGTSSSTSSPAPIELVAAGSLSSYKEETTAGKRQRLEALAARKRPKR